MAAADLDSAGQHAYVTGFIHSQRQQGDAVLACANRAAAHWTTAKAGAREGALAIRLRGLGHQLKKEYPAAIANFHMSLDLFRSLPIESENVTVVLSDIANLERSSGDYDAAEAHFREALRVARDGGLAEIVAGTTCNLALLELNRQAWPAAETIAREALILCESVHRQELIAGSNRYLAQAIVHQGRAAEALPYAWRAVDIYTHLGHPDLVRAQATLTECGG